MDMDTMAEYAYASYRQDMMDRIELREERADAARRAAEIADEEEKNSPASIADVKTLRARKFLRDRKSKLHDRKCKLRNAKKLTAAASACEVVGVQTQKTCKN